MELVKAVLGEVGLAVALPLPAAMLTSAVSLTVRNFVGGGAHTGSHMRDPLVDALLVYCGLLVAGLVFTPQPGVEVRTRWMPGADVWTALSASPGDLDPWIQLAGNILLLFPLGALLPMRMVWLNTSARICVAALLLSCAIELTQYLLITGRVVSTDDVVLNTVGATLGSLFTRSKRTRRTRSAPQHGEGYPVRWLISEIEKEHREAGRLPARH